MDGEGGGREPSLGGRATSAGREPGIGGERATAAALEWLKSEDWKVRLRAVHELGKQKDNLPIEQLAHMLNDWNSRVRGEAAAILIEIGEPSLSVLTGILPRADTITRKIIVHIFTKICTPELLVSLMGAPGSENAAVRAAAFASIRQLGKSAVPVLLGVLDSENPGLRFDAVRLLGYLEEPDALPGLVRLLTDTEPDIRMLAAYYLVYRPLSQEAVSALIDCLQDHDEYVRHHAALTLGHVTDPRVIQPLFDTANNDADIIVRVAAIRSLGHLEVAEAVPVSNSMLYTKTLLETLDTILQTLRDVGDEMPLYDYEATRDAIVEHRTETSAFVRHLTNMAEVWHACYNRQKYTTGRESMLLANILKQIDAGV